MRNYWRLLRLSYQLQLAPIFGWGYFLAGGRLEERSQILFTSIVFLCFHIGCFGGLTALNSFYDCDTAPIGGMWNPPATPRFLWLFAWSVQIVGVFPLLYFDWKLATIYSAIVALALGYSHPRTRWKSDPKSSLIVVALGQGVLGTLAGACTPLQPANAEAVFIGSLGAAAMVCAWYPLTQLFQTSDDTLRGDHTVALQLLENGGRVQIFIWAKEGCGFAMSLNVLALIAKGLWPDALLFAMATSVPMLYLNGWQQSGDLTPENDFHRVHRLLRYNAICFGAYLLARLTL